MLVFILTRFIFFPLWLVYQLINFTILKLPKHINVKLELNGKYSENPPENGLGKLLKKTKPSFYQLMQDLFELQQASQVLLQKKSKKKLHLNIIISNLELGWGQLWELRQSLLKLKVSGVTVNTYCKQSDWPSLYIALASSTISVSPSAGFYLPGLQWQGFFLKSFFDKYDIKPNFIHIGDFKSASERYEKKRHSSFAKKQLKELLSSVKEELELAIKNRIMGKEKSNINFEKITANPILSAKQMADLHLTDFSCYQEEWNKILENKYSIKKIKNLSLSKVITRLNKINFSVFHYRKKISTAVICLNGVINQSNQKNSHSIVEPNYTGLIKKIQAQNYDAVVLRINSPGGSAVVSDNLWRQLISLRHDFNVEEFCEQDNWQNYPNIEEENTNKKEKKNSKKSKSANKTKYIVSMGNVAASGGYYLAATSKNIYASKLSITGSIGVIMGKFNIAGVLKNLGINIDNIEVGKNADLFSALKNFSPQQVLTIKKSMNLTYDQFINRISVGRDIPEKEIKRVAEGRVYSGEKAKQLNLVDKIGGLSQVYSDLLDKKSDKIKIDYYPQIKTGILDKQKLMPNAYLKVKSLLTLNKESFLYIDENLL